MAEVGGGEGAKVRVVRCPKCEKLLPELANFTVYKCGGCNATLQAKKPNASMESSSDGEKMKISENSESSSNAKRMGSDTGSENDYEAEGCDCRGADGMIPNKAVNFEIAGVPKSENKEVSKELMKKDNGRCEKIYTLKEPEDRGITYQSPSKALVSEFKPKVDEIAKRDVADNLESKVQLELPNGLPKVAEEQISKDEERDRVLFYQRAPRASKGGSIRYCPYPDEGPSNYHLHRNPQAPSRVEKLEEDRAELLRKLDELRDQLRQSCEVTGKTREQTSTCKRAVSSGLYGNCGNDTWFPDNSTSLHQTSSQHAPFSNGHGVDIPQFYPAMHPPSDIPGYKEPFGSQTLGMAPFPPHVQYPQRPYNNYPYCQLDASHAISCHHDGLYPQPACSCLHCCNRQWPFHAQAPPAIFGNQRTPFFVHDHGFYHVEAPSMFGRQSYNQRVGSACLHPNESQVNKRAVFSKMRRSCRPVAGAAPFVICCNCSKVLELPRKLMLVKKSRFKLRCGSCSQVISVEFDGKKLITSGDAQITHARSETNNGSHHALRESSHYDGHINHNSDISYSGDFDSPAFEVQSTDEKLVLPSSFSNSSPEMQDKLQGLSSSSSSLGDEESPDSIICQGDVSRSTEIPTEVEGPSNGPGLPLCEHFGYPLSNHVTNGPGKGSRSRRSDQEKIVSVNGNFKQNSVKDVSVACEMDLSVDDYPNPGFVQDPLQASRDEDQAKISKSSESFFAGFIKKSFKDFRFNLENGRSRVSVNGHPISDRLVKKAEKQAGPIYPGEYWYDYRAGFWGVMGQHCLGIIPPFIEEFNYPMPKTCAGGTTGVLVNGRELHQKDLELLVGRGLLPIEGQSYIIDISGKVWHEATGEELDGLGKLAPTVERVKHGFGMRVPRVIA